MDANNIKFSTDDFAKSLCVCIKSVSDAAFQFESFCEKLKQIKFDKDYSEDIDKLEDQLSRIASMQLKN